MVLRFNSFNRIVTALVCLVGLSGPLMAQETVLDELFQELFAADETSHERIAGQIANQWQRSGSAAMDLLYRRGEEALEEDDPQAAVEHFTALVDHAPDFAEAYHGRASAYFALDLTGPALADLQTVLALAPRHYQAMFGFGAILEGLERPEEAMEVYREVLKIYPLFPQALDGVARLSLQLDGQAL